MRDSYTHGMNFSTLANEHQTHLGRYHIIRGVKWNTRRIGLWNWDAVKGWRATSAPGSRTLSDYAHAWGPYVTAPEYIYRPTRRERQGAAKRFENVRDFYR